MYGLLLAVTSAGPALGVTLLNRLADHARRGGRCSAPASSAGGSPARQPKPDPPERSTLAVRYRFGIPRPDASVGRSSWSGLRRSCRRLRRAAACTRRTAHRAHLRRRLARHTRPRSDLSTSARRLVFHDGRWSAESRCTTAAASRSTCASGRPPTRTGSVWNGPALVYSGKDVLGDRRLIYVPADTAKPEMPFPLARGATWRGTVVGKVPAKPPLPPKGEPIWLRYPGLRRRRAVRGIVEQRRPRRPDQQGISNR